MLNIGRGMTPTLALLVEWEAQIYAFQSTPFYTVQLDCGSLTATSERLTERAEAERIAALCDSTRMLVEQTVKVLPLMKKGMFLCNIARVIDNGKVTDHYALIPTVGIAGQNLLSLPAGERSLLTLLMVRLLCTVGKPCRIHETAVTLECEGVSFSLKGRQITDLGWKAMEKFTGLC